MTDCTFTNHLIRHMAFSRATFGPGSRTGGVIDHLRKEIEEVELSYGSADEWVDVVILAIDGLTRSIGAVLESRGEADPNAAVARYAVEMIRAKQGRNELRDWPDWRTADTSKAIEHVRD
ncbi:hypothetical protein ATO13_22326 [Stappia sp. 22II-S9-Z10]|nr:hypothetical protein ATO13_22326 [Stappia sp. 22II-S9-Z10]